MNRAAKFYARVPYQHFRGLSTAKTSAKAPEKKKLSTLAPFLEEEDNEVHPYSSSFQDLKAQLLDTLKNNDYELDPAKRNGTSLLASSRHEKRKNYYSSIDEKTVAFSSGESIKQVVRTLVQESPKQRATTTRTHLKTVATFGDETKVVEEVPSDPADVAKFEKLFADKSALGDVENEEKPLFEHSMQVSDMHGSLAPFESLFRREHDRLSDRVENQLREVQHVLRLMSRV